MLLAGKWYLVLNISSNYTKKAVFGVSLPETAFLFCPLFAVL
jgi:hypothetical protein